MTEQMSVPKLRFGEFSKDLSVLQLSDIINELESGVSVNSEDMPPSSNESGILKTSAIYAGNFIPKEAKVITDESELRRAKLNPKKDSIIISRMNTPALVGESGYVFNDYPNLFIPDRLWQATVSSQHCARWLSFLLTSPRTRFIISSKGTGTSNSMKNISKPSFLSISAVTPELAEQQKIASFLSKVDEKIALLTEKKAKLTEYKKGVMQQLFNGKWQEQDGKLVFVPPTLRFKADDGSEFPDWEELTLGKFAVLQSGYAFSSDLFSDSGRRLITPKNFTKTGKAIFNDSNTKFTLENVDQKYLCKGGELLLLLTDLTPDCRMLGKPVLLEDDAEVLLNQRIVKFEITHPKSLSKAFVFQYFLTPKWNNRMRITATGTTVRHSSNKIVLNTTLGIPSIDEQIKISDFLSSIDRKIELVNSELDKAKEWKKGLLQQMFV
ncbi:restriction endonuclease subunit S [Vibrio vulnificus]|nr:hypothetical protein [Vibrio vulnificus]EHH2450990.1 hypothetical protein [Vibrio vulnificus]EIA1303551.1 restriction endonuclease subunit S [Vibrio vulnificus]EIZ4669699.1 restriction endonuclease subunit S [Vibrio vulnificus]EJB5284246.1 restriction endonuclease subunit S [Vibrio vulnificus]